MPAATTADRAAARAVLADLLAGLRHRDCGLVGAATTSQQLRELCGQVRLTSYRLADRVGDAQDPVRGAGQKRVAVDVAMNVADGPRLMPYGRYRQEFFVHQGSGGTWRVADVAWPASDGTAVPAADVAAARAVLDGYLEAFARGDCRAADRFWTPGSHGNLCGLSASDIQVTGAGLPFRDGEVGFATTMTTRGGDGSMPDGRHVWFYTVTRQRDGSWMITAGGSGP